MGCFRQQKQHGELTQLKDLIPLSPWKTSPVSLGVQYVKLKEPIYKNGVKVYWKVKDTENEEEEDPELYIPFQGVFEFVDRHVVRVMKNWINKLFGPLFSLPMST